MQWSAIESALALVSACLPSLPNLSMCLIHLRRPWNSFRGRRSWYKSPRRPWTHTINAATPGSHFPDSHFRRLDDSLGTKNGSTVLVESCQVHSITEIPSIPLNAIQVRKEFSVDRVYLVPSVNLKLERPNKAAV